MPQHHTWFDVLLGNFYSNMEHASQALGGTLIGGDEGTWLEGQHVGVQHVFGALFVVILLGLMAFSFWSKNRDIEKAIVPSDRFSGAVFLELLTEVTYGQMNQMMGGKAAKFFLPLIGTCAFFILFSNAIGLIPGMLPPTESLNTTLAMGGVIFIATHIFGVVEHGPGYFKHFFGPIIKWYALPLMLLMLVIETISHLVRPLSLALRLMANIVGDHKVLALFSGLIPFIVPIPFYVLGVLVVVVQTMVFCLLSTVYISMAVAHEEH